MFSTGHGRFARNLHVLAVLTCTTIPSDGGGAVVILCCCVYDHNRTIVTPELTQVQRPIRRHHYHRWHSTAAAPPPPTRKGKISPQHENRLYHNTVFTAQNASTKYVFPVDTVFSSHLPRSNTLVERKLHMPRNREMHTEEDLSLDQHTR